MPAILVALDGSEFAAHALQVASALAEPLAAQLGLVSVLDIKLVSGEAGVSAAAQLELLRGEAQGVLDTAAAAASAPHAWKFVREGTPWKEIIRSAQEWPADLIVVGTHGRSGATRLLFGSTAEGVTRHATVPVVVVSPASRKAGTE
jgi:nucleotide-binding universal stress UspA family protein